MRKALLLSLLTLTLFPHPASAAETAMPTRQAVAYGMDWVPYIDPADLPPVAQRKVVCLVDSGVDITPDLPPDNFAGPIVERISVDRGSGLPGTAWENQHGTRMALIAGAVPGNDYGTVGAWPAVRILSVRAMGQGEKSFRGEYYEQGIRVCNDATSRYPIAAVNLSLSCDCALDDRERAVLADAIGSVRTINKDVSVVAAAGNRPGDVQTPADVGGVLAVAAGAQSELCAYAAWDPRALVGPGCNLETADDGTPVVTETGGSSSASVYVATLIAVLRTLRPDASHRDVETWIFESARRVNGLLLIDGEAAAAEGQLAEVVARARGRMPVAPIEQAEATSHPASATVDAANQRVLPKPLVQARWFKRWLTLRIGARPAWTRRAEVVILRKGAGPRQVRTSRARIRIWLRTAPRRIWIRWLPLRGSGVAPSPWQLLARGKGNRFR
jgi:hypothetical protein